MLKPLTLEQSTWVEETLASMTTAEKVGHLLCPTDSNRTPEEWRALLQEVPLGSIFFGFTPEAPALAAIQAAQSASRIPLLIASDLEHGAGAMIPSATNFPFPMALGAAGEAELARQMGRVTAREGRAYGVHWTFSPVVDLNINFQNPVTNIRALGDDPARVAALAQALIEGLQESGEMAATAKHFPGDGMDDRDQHICTSVNSCSMPEWWASYGRVWQAAIDAGVQSIMVGHITLPDYLGLPPGSLAAMPATLETRLQSDLLRGELGFEGLIVSDAAVMIGIASRLPAGELAVQNILSGSDVYLFCEPRQDFAHLIAAVQDGRLSLPLLDEKVRRVLAMKARLGLHRSVSGPAISDEERRQHAWQAQALAEQSITLLRANACTPIRLQPGAKVLTVTVRYPDTRGEPDWELKQIDRELEQRGLQVDHLNNPSGGEIAKIARQYAAVFMNVVVYPHARIGTVRLTGELVMPFWESFYASYPNAVFTAFGSPYLLYELLHLPNLYLAYSHTPPSLAAAVRAWLGEYEPQGQPPVRLPVV